MGNPSRSYTDKEFKIKRKQQGVQSQGEEQGLHSIFPDKKEEKHLLLSSFYRFQDTPRYLNKQMMNIEYKNLPEV